MKDWDYAQMTHDAALCGGPESYVNAIRMGGLVDGRIEGAIGATVVILTIGGIVRLVIDKVKTRRINAAIAEEKVKVCLAEQEIGIWKKEEEEDDSNQSDGE